ncbi:unnamed protein product [Urochloa decumbens]|uniref:Uncharacterized protein n=1 Tax=Urochloa decumbens TaxID=240449 RepID=A0ABC9B8R2_9POAL
MAAHGRAAAGPKPSPFPGFPTPPPSAPAKRRWAQPAPPRRGSFVAGGSGVVGDLGSGAAGIGGSYLGAEAAALLACVTATLLVLPLLLPPLPPPPPLFLLVPVAIFAVLLLLVLVPSDAAGRGAAATVGPHYSGNGNSSYR